MSSRQATMLLANTLLMAGCATADLRPNVVRHETPKQIRDKFHGPDVSVRAKPVLGRMSHQIQPSVSVADSAYVVVGDIGDDGTLRILFPELPTQSAFVARQASVSVPAFTPRVFFPLTRSVRVGENEFARVGAGHVFVIASSKPLDLQRLVEDGRWSLFDVYYDDHDSDPRPAITDLAVAISSSVNDLSIAWAAYGGGEIETAARPAQRNEPAVTRRLPRPPR